MLPILEELSEEDPAVLLEPMAGQGRTLASSLESTVDYLEAVNYHPKLRLCIDTAHLLAAGEPLDEAKGGERLLQRLRALGLMDRVDLFHTNDSAFPRDSHRDRHANLGFGHIHLETWKSLASTGIPLILETPGAHFLSDLKVLRRAVALEN